MERFQDALDAAMIDHQQRLLPHGGLSQAPIELIRRSNDIHAQTCLRAYKQYETEMSNASLFTEPSNSRALANIQATAFSLSQANVDEKVVFVFEKKR